MKHFRTGFVILMGLCLTLFVSSCGGGGGSGAGTVKPDLASLIVSEGTDHGGEVISGDAEIVMLELAMNATEFGVRVRSMSFTGSGTGNELTDITGVKIYVDSDLDGAFVLANDQLIAGPATFIQDDGTVTINFNPEYTVPVTTDATWFVVYELNESSSAGETFGLVLNSITATESGTVTTADITGTIATSGGAGSISIDQTVFLNTGVLSLNDALVESYDEDLVLQHFSAAGNYNSDFDIETVVFTVTSTDDTEFENFELMLDADNDGIADGAALGTATLANGLLTFSNVGHTVTANQTDSFMLIVDIPAKVTTNNTIQTSLVNASSVIIDTAGALIQGTPLTGRTLTLTFVPPTVTLAAGSLSLTDATVNSRDTDVALQHVAVSSNVNYDFTINNLVFTLTVDDSNDFSNFELWLDADNDGVADGGAALGTANLVGSTLTIGTMNYAFTNGQTDSFLLIVDIAEPVTDNDTLQTSLADSDAISTDIVGQTVEGTALNGRTVTVDQDEMTLAAGSLALVDATVDNNDTDVVLQHFAVSSSITNVANFTINTFVFTLTSADTGEFSNFEVWLDADNDGVADGGAALGTAALVGSTLTFSTVNHSFTTGQTDSFLLIVDIDAVVTKGNSVQSSLANSTAFSTSITGPIVNGTPLTGRTVSLNNKVTAAIVLTDAVADTVTEDIGTTTLDGTGSDDIDAADSITTYAWTITNVPPVGVALTNADQATATLAIVNVMATYTVDLRLDVSSDDGTTAFAIVTLNVTADNDAPTAVITALASAIVAPAVDVPLSGANSTDPDGDDTLTYAWTFDKPGGDPALPAGVQFADDGTGVPGATSTLEAPTLNTVDDGRDYTVIVSLTVTDSAAQADNTTTNVLISGVETSISFDQSSIVGSEAVGTITFDIELTTTVPGDTIPGDITMELVIMNSGNTTKDQDYTATFGTITFAAGTVDGTPAATQTITVTVLDDAVPEGVETLDLSLNTLAGFGASFGALIDFRLQIQDNDDRNLFGVDIASDALLSFEVDFGFSMRRSPWSVGGFPQISSLAFDPTPNQKRFFGVDAETTELLVFNINTGDATVIGSVGLPNVVGLSYDTTTDRLYCVNVSSNVSLLYELSTVTGIARVVGNIGFDNVQSLAFNGVDAFYAVDIDTDQLISVNVSSGGGTVIATLPIDYEQVQGLAYTGTLLYGVDRITDKLLTIDTTTAATTIIGTVNSGNIDGLVFDTDSSILYAVDTNSDQLLTVSTTTGAGSSFANVGFPKVRGMAYDANADILYGVESESARLISIDSTTGKPSFIGALGFSDIRSLAYDATTDTLYGVDTFQDVLIAINVTTGAGTKVHATNLIGYDNVRGLAFDSNSNTLYATDVDTDVLISINTTTGLGVLIGALSLSNVESLTYDSVTDTLYGVDLVTDNLITINTGTGAGTAIDNTNMPNVEALGFDINGTTLFGVDTIADQLINLNTVTGASAAIAALGFETVTAMAYDPGTDTIYAYDNFHNTLLTIDPITGEGTSIAVVGAGNVQAMAYNRNTDILYAMTNGNNRGWLLTIDVTTGATVTVDAGDGNNGQMWTDTAQDGFTVDADEYVERIAGMAIDPHNNILYVAIDNSTGDFLVIISMNSVFVNAIYSPFGYDIDGMTFDPDTSTLYGIDAVTDQLMTINQGNGAATPKSKTLYGSIYGITWKD